jgi:hypothetical protein
VFLGDSLTAGYQNGSLLGTQQPKRIACRPHAGSHHYAAKAKDSAPGRLAHSCSHDCIMVSHRPTAWTGGAITHFVVVFGQFQVRTARGGARTGSFLPRLLSPKNQQLIGDSA